MTRIQAAVFGYLSIAFLDFSSVVFADATVDDDDACNLYMAPSTTGTTSSTEWGLFAGKNFEDLEAIGDASVAINLFDLRANSEGEDEEEHGSLKELVSFLEGFLWVPDSAGAKFETSDGNAMTFIPGSGILSAMNVKMTNAEWDHVSAYQRPLVGEQPGVAHAGRGAQTPFYNIVIRATEKIAKGSEIFLNYGANYEDDDEDDFEKSDYEKLDATIQKMIEFFGRHEEELDEQAKMQIYGFLTRDVMNAAVGSKRLPRIGKILPSHPDKLKDILDKGGSVAVDHDVSRDMEWLKKEGFCADNIRFGPSTIKEAGRGAFATRTLKAGTTITGSPLIPISDPSVFDMHPMVKNEKDNFVLESEEVINKQLALNYCFGHPEASMLLLPTGSGVAFINHKKEPNAKLVWSKKPSSSTEWFETAPAELMDEGLVLVMEIVALDTIQSGEEIFLDYGDSWTAAWEAHAKQWDSEHKGETWPTRAIELKEKYLDAPFPTEKEQSDAQDAYPEDVALVAFIMIAESTAAGTLEDPKVWDTPKVGSVYDAQNLFEVAIVDRIELEDKSWSYTIRWLNVQGKATYVQKVPHDAFVLVDRPSTGDSFVTKPFRHPIHIPDDVFPKGTWRDIASAEK